MTYISPDDKIPDEDFLNLDGGSDSEARLMDTDTAGRRRFTDKVDFTTGSSDTLEGKSPDKLLPPLLVPGFEFLVWKLVRGCTDDEGCDDTLFGCFGASCLTGGWILLLMTTYFWSLDEAENDNVVPFLTFVATFRGTFNRTGFPPFWGRTRIETCSEVAGERFAADDEFILGIEVEVKDCGCWGGRWEGLTAMYIELLPTLGSWVAFW